MKIGIEAGIRMGWDQLLGRDGSFVGVETFGKSAPAEDLFEAFSLNSANVVKIALSKIAEITSLRKRGR